MDSSSESEDEVFFGPITEKEMMIRNQKGLSEDERSVENEEIFISEHFSTGEQNICSNHSLAVTVSHVNQGDISHMSDEKIYSSHPKQQTSEWSESYYCDTLGQEHISDQKVLYKPICEESDTNITCLENNYNQRESVDGQENGYVSDNLSASITNAIHDGENEYGEFDNTLRSIEELENSFIQVTLDGCETIDHLSSVVRETKIDPNDTNNFVSLTTPDKSKNICFTVCVGGEGTGLFNTSSDMVVNDSCSSQLNNSVKVIDICNHVANCLENVNHSNQNEFDSNSAVLSKIIVEPVSSDSTLSFKTCNITNSASTIVSIKSSESAFSEVQSSSSSNVHCSLVSDHEIPSAAERNSIIKLYTDNRNTSEILFENLSINNSESVTNLQMDFDLCDTSSKSEKNSYTSGVSKLFATDLNNRSRTTVSEKGDEICDLKTTVSVELKDNAQETNNIETIYNPQDQNEDTQNGESDILNINGKTDFCNIENHDTEGNIYKKDTVTTGNTEVSVFSEVSQLNSVDTTRENEPASRDEAVYIFKTTETSIKEVESSELSFEIMQKINNKTPSEMNTYETDSFKDSSAKSSESTTEINVCEINEHIAISTGNMIPQSDGEIINEYTETGLKVQNNPDNIIFKPSVVENIHTNSSCTETYGTQSNEILGVDSTSSNLTEEICKTACDVKNSYEDMPSNKNLITEIAYSSHDTTHVSVNICESVDELNDNFLNIASASSNDNLSSKGVNLNLSMTDLIRPFLKNTEEEKENFHDKNVQMFSNVTSMKNENVYEGITGKSLQEEKKLDFSKYNEVDGSESYKTDRENHEEIGMKQTIVIDDAISKQGEPEYEEPMDISYGDLSVKNTEQWKAYRLTIDLDASLLGDIITETEFKQVLDSEEASFNLARSKDGNKCISDIDSAVADNGSLQKSNKKRVVTNSATKLPKQQKSLIKSPLFHPKTDELTVQRKWALNLVSTKPSTADNKNTGARKYSSSSEKCKLQKPSTAPKSSICREPKSQSKLKQENTITPTAKRKIELTKPASSPNNLKRNERFKQIESPIRAYINNSPSSMTSKMSSHGNDDKSLLDTKISKQEFSKSTEKKVSHIPMLRTPRLQINTNIPKRKVDTTENVDPNRGSHKSTPRVKESPCSKLPRYDKLKKLSSTPLSKPHKSSEKDTGSLVLQDKANYELHDPQASPNRE